jgi:hypothetical protein
MKSLFNMLGAAFICTCCTFCVKTDERSLPYNFLGESNTDPLTIDTVIIAFPSPTFKTLRVEFHPNLDSLTADQQSLVTGFRLYENNIEQANMPVTQRHFVRPDQPKGKVLRWELVLMAIGGESKRSKAFVYTVP